MPSSGRTAAPNPPAPTLRERGLADTIQAKTGLLVDAYFSGTKLKWMLDNVPGARQQADNGELAFGTIDSWLIWQLTAGRRCMPPMSATPRAPCCSMCTPTSGTPNCMAALDIPASLMPSRQALERAALARCSADLLGQAIPIGGVAGDQQSALFGQACFKAGMVKNTYGTGCFMLMHTGTDFQTSSNGLITTSAAQTTAQPEFALEGSVFVGGAVVQWLRDGLHAIPSSAEVQALAESVPDSGGVMVVPAFTGPGRALLEARCARLASPA